jgi:aspartate 1-decarboxylase
VTEASLDYEGSMTLDQDLMDLAGIVPHEFVMVSNRENGERFETYVIPGPRGSGVVCLNGATARKGVVGDRLFIFSTAYVPEDELSRTEPKIIFLSEDNKPVKTL